MARHNESLVTALADELQGGGGGGQRRDGSLLGGADGAASVRELQHLPQLGLILSNQKENTIISNIYSS